jgi:hypothetical protein
MHAPGGKQPPRPAAGAARFSLTCPRRSGEYFALRRLGQAVAFEHVDKPGAIMSTIDDLLGTWADPPAIYRSAPFWSWNSRLDADRLCRAIESMHRAGMGGFFMHSRYGLKTPYLSEEWFACVSACVEKARELGMHAYLYDEDRWPSGSAGGLVTRKHPDFGMHFLLCTPRRQPEKNAERLATFAVRLDGGGRLLGYEPLEPDAGAPAGAVRMSFDAVPQEPRGWYNDAPYLDTMNPEAVRDFLHVTHQAYADRYGRDFGTLVPAIFTDEPNYLNHGTRAGEGEHVAPWTPGMPREFKKRRGYDVRDRLPEVIFPAAEGEFSKVRHDFYRTATELFVEAFSAQIGRWCGKHKIALTGHVLQEQTLRTQIEVVGACMPHYEHFQWPGIDILTDQARELMTAKQCSSAADQLGRPRVLSELYGCTGWDWPLEGHKFVGDWQFAAGVNFRCPHLTHFSLAGGAKRDYPASIFSHSPWWKYYGVVEDYFARLSFLLTRGEPLRDVLVLHPVESGWGCFHAAGETPLLAELDDAIQRITRTLSGQHYDWDFADESLLAAHGSVTKKGLKVGRLTYRVVLVPPSITLRGTTVKLLGKFQAAGGKMLFVGRRPDRVDAEPSDALALLTDAARMCDDAEQFLGVLADMLPQRVSITEAGAEASFVWYMLRKVQGGQVLFLQSHDRKAARTVRVTVAGKAPAVLWDARTGVRTRLGAAATGRGKAARVAFDLHLPPTGSALVSLGLDVPDAAPPRPEPSVAQARTIEGPFDIQRTEPNTLPLDYCCYSFGDEPFSDAMPTLKADAQIRSRFGLGSRIGGGQQPWYLYAMGTVDTAPRGRCRLRFGFHVTELPGRCALALERPEDYRVTVNGKAAGPPDGFWVDEDIRTLDVTGLLAAGDNEVLLTMDYRPDMELEDMYLVGEFGVRVAEGGAPRPGAMTLVAAPRRLNLGSWVGQGLDSYGGGVLYKLKVERPAGQRIRIRLPGIDCTAAAIHAGDKAFVLPWPPFEAEITDALAEGTHDVTVEVIGGRKNILGPLHVPHKPWTGPGEFDPNNRDWIGEYQLFHHGLMEPVVVETLA